MSWSQLGEFASAVGPWALLCIIILFLVWAFALVRMVLKTCEAKATDRDVSISVRPFPWPRVEIDLKSPASALPEAADEATPVIEAVQPAALPAASAAQPAALPAAEPVQQPAAPTA